jgi:acetylornithine deacetylase
VVPGARAVTVGRGPRVGPVARDARHREVPRRADRRAHGARAVDPLRRRRAAARARRHRLDDRARGEAARVARRELTRALGWHVSAAAGRRAAASTSTRRLAGTPPTVVLSTHFDCVPPFFPSRVEGGRLYGRGACDAKGILAAQVAAAERLRAEGATTSRCCSSSGEERGSDGAAVANRLSPSPRYLVNGEPTDSRLATATTRGVARAPVGRRARRALVEPGAGSVGHREAVDALVALRGLDLPGPGARAHALHGRAHRRRRRAERRPAGRDCRGDVPHGRPVGRRARASRAAPAVGRRRGRARGPAVTMAPSRVRHRGLLVCDRRAAADAWGEPLLFGPGSIQVAHTDGEHIEITELEAAVGAYVRLARSLALRTPGDRLARVLCGRGSRGADRLS